MKILGVLTFFTIGFFLSPNVYAGGCNNPSSSCPVESFCLDDPESGHDYHCEFQVSEGDGFKLYNVETGGSRSIVVSFHKTIETNDMCNMFSISGDLKRVENSEMNVADLRIISTKKHCTLPGSRQISLKSVDYAIALADAVDGFSVLVPEGFVLKVRR